VPITVALAATTSTGDNSTQTRFLLFVLCRTGKPRHFVRPTSLAQTSLVKLNFKTIFGTSERKVFLQGRASWTAFQVAWSLRRRNLWPFPSSFNV